MSLLNEFCQEFGIEEEALGTVTRVGRSCFLTLPGQEEFLETDGLFGVGIFLGEEKKYFEPSPALIELIAGKVTEHKAIVDEKAAWLFLCGRDIFDKGVKEKGTATNKGYLLVQNEEGENLGYGLHSHQKNILIKHLQDRGFYLRRERK
jgi:ribosome biogenesis protein Nip4